MSGIPDFPAFYAAVHRRDPFPWQARLARQVVEDGWPDEIGVPTGLGKTACIDIAVWAMASEAGRDPAEQRQPRRIWYVVNRRLLVDAADEEGNDLAKQLNNPAMAEDSAVRHTLQEVATALRSLGSVEGRALHVSRLRGGAALGERPPDPAMPSLILATVPMFASRWLFRGYGCSTLMSPVDAALAGTDSLVLLDEAHLALPLSRLGEPLAQCDPGRAGVPLPDGRRRPRITRLTATGFPRGDRFDLDDVDQRHPTIARRLAATKPTRLVSVDRRGLVASMVAEAASLLNRHSDRTCLVFANSPRTAREVFDRLAKGRPDGEVLLLTGQVRSPDGNVLRKQILCPANGLAAETERSSTAVLRCVVATQTLEVGADLDADHLVTESAGRRALVQRLGRLNRLGLKDHASAVVCHADDAVPGPLYGEEPAEVAERLREKGPVSLSPAVINEVLGPPGDEEVAAAEALPALVWEWVKTSLPPSGEAPVERYFSEPEDEVARVSICWRAFIPDDGRRLRPPVRADETVDVGIGVIRTLLRDQAEKGEPWSGARLAADRLSIDTPLGVDQVRPGDVLVMPSAWGHYDRHGWAPDARATVTDLSFGAARHLALNTEVLRYLFEEGAARDTVEGRVGELRASLDAAVAETLADGHGVAEQDVACDGLIQALHDDGLVATAEGAESWLDLRRRLPGAANGSNRWLRDGKELYLELAPPDKPRRVLRSDEADDLCFLSKSIRLVAHLQSVGEMGERIARAVGLAPTLVAAVGEAGRLHDLGKYDDRFQRLLGGDDGPPVAKSGGARTDADRQRVEAGWPRGGRHEVLSARLVEAWLSGSSGLLAGLDRDLVVHLVLSHHGHGRPSTPAVRDPGIHLTTGQVGGAEVMIASSLADPEWQQPRRFRQLCERYGYWGLALLEAVVRQADHRASAWSEADAVGAAEPVDMGVV